MIAALVVLAVAVVALLVFAFIVWDSVDTTRDRQRSETRADVEAIEPLVALVLDDLKAQRSAVAAQQQAFVDQTIALMREQAAERERLLIAALDSTNPMRLLTQEIAAEQSIELAHARERVEAVRAMARQDQARADERYEEVTG